MSVSIAIHPMSDSLDMYGSPDTSSAYSLSGHVSISLSSPFSLFERRRTARVLLQSISLTFEGQSEIVTPKIGYSGLRLCSITKEIAPPSPIELNNEGHEDDATPSQWNVVFNLPIPGWLPQTSNFGVEEVGSRYALYATAKFLNVDDNHSSSWSFSTLCAPFRSKTRTVEVNKAIVVKRFIQPPTDSPFTPESVTYLVNSPSKGIDASKAKIPVDLLAKIQVLASVPEHTDILSDAVPLTLRLRTKDMADEDCKRIKVTSFSVDVLQRERCRYKPTPEYLARYPVPPQSQQPPHRDLRNPHPISTVYDIGLYPLQCFEETCDRSFSLMPLKETGKYDLPANNYAFANDASSSDSTWYTVETGVPFVSTGRASEQGSMDWAGAAVIRPSGSTPLFGINHDLSVSITCSYDLPDSDECPSERLTFCVPITFVSVAPQLPPPRSPTPPPSHSRSSSTSSSAPTMGPVSASSSPRPNLPAYSSLFDSNGDRKIDYSVPLPLYSPRAAIVSELPKGYEPETDMFPTEQMPLLSS